MIDTDYISYMSADEAALYGIRKAVRDAVKLLDYAGILSAPIASVPSNRIRAVRNDVQDLYSILKDSGVEP